MNVRSRHFDREMQSAVDVITLLTLPLDSLIRKGFQQKNEGKDWLERARSRSASALATITPKQLRGLHLPSGNVILQMAVTEEAVREFQRSLDLDHNSDEALRLPAMAYHKNRQRQRCAIGLPALLLSPPKLLRRIQRVRDFLL